MKNHNYFSCSKNKDAITICSKIKSLDYSNVKYLKDCFEQINREHISEIIFDISKVDIIDSSGIGALIYMHKELTSRKSLLILSGVSKGVFEVITLLRLNYIFKINEKTAVKH